MNATDTPKAIPIAAPGEGTIATREAAGLGLRPTLLEEWHFLRLAIVCRSGGHPPPRKTRFRLLARLCRAGLVTRRASMKGFTFEMILLSRASWRKVRPI